MRVIILLLTGEVTFELESELRSSPSGKKGRFPRKGRMWRFEMALHI